MQLEWREGNWVRREAAREVHPGLLTRSRTIGYNKSEPIGFFFCSDEVEVSGI
jgi:hypothetical protein